MKAPALERTSAAKAGWLIALIFVGWLVFLLVPGPRDEPTPAETLKPHQSKLRVAGLPDNPDFDGLPEIFAIWADKADWINNRTKFGYWNPGAKDYTYFFEAIREDGMIRFRQIARPADLERSNNATASTVDEHPLKFFHTATETPWRYRESDGPGFNDGPRNPLPESKPVAPRIPIDVQGASIKPPKVEAKDYTH